MHEQTKKTDKLSNKCTPVVFNVAINDFSRTSRTKKKNVEENASNNCCIDDNLSLNS